MKLIYLMFAGLFMTACVRDYSVLKPDHIAVKTGVDFEMQKDSDLKTKPSIETTFNWSL